MHRRLFFLPLALFTGCTRSCESPVPRSQTVYLRGTADPEIRLVEMDDKWGTEDRTASVTDGRYEFAWTGKDLTAFLGGERSFKLWAPVDRPAGRPYIESEEFYLRSNLEVPLHLWNPPVQASAGSDGSLSMQFASMQPGRHQEASQYSVTLGFSRSLTRLDGTRQASAGSLTRSATPAATRIEATAFAGRDDEKIQITLAGHGRGVPILHYHSGTQTASVPTPPEERLVRSGGAGGGVSQVRLKSAEDAQERTVAVPPSGRYVFEWTGRQLQETLGSLRLRVEAGPNDDLSRVRSAVFRLRDVSVLPDVQLWNPLVSIERIADGGLSVRFAALQGSGFQAISRYLLRVRYSRLDANDRMTDGEASLEVGAGETALGTDRVQGLLTDRAQEEIEVRVEASGRGHPVDLEYRSAPVRVRLPVTARRQTSLGIDSVEREIPMDRGTERVRVGARLHCTLPIQEVPSEKSRLRGEEDRLRARMKEILYAHRREDFSQSGFRSALAEELRREFQLLLGRPAIERVEITEFTISR